MGRNLEQAQEGQASSKADREQNKNISELSLPPVEALRPITSNKLDGDIEEQLRDALTRLSSDTFRERSLAQIDLVKLIKGGYANVGSEIIDIMHDIDIFYNHERGGRVLEALNRESSAARQALQEVLKQNNPNTSKGLFARTLFQNVLQQAEEELGNKPDLRNIAGLPTNLYQDEWGSYRQIFNPKAASSLLEKQGNVQKLFSSIEREQLLLKAPISTFKDIEPILLDEQERLSYLILKECFAAKNAELRAALPNIRKSLARLLAEEPEIRALRSEKNAGEQSQDIDTKSEIISIYRNSNLRRWQISADRAFSLSNLWMATGNEENMKLLAIVPEAHHQILKDPLLILQECKNEVQTKTSLMLVRALHSTYQQQLTFSDNDIDVGNPIFRDLLTRYFEAYAEDKLEKPVSDELDLCKNISEVRGINQQDTIALYQKFLKADADLKSVYSFYANTLQFAATEKWKFEPKESKPDFKKSIDRVLSAKDPEKAIYAEYVALERLATVKKLPEQEGKAAALKKLITLFNSGEWKKLEQSFKAILPDSR